MAVTLSTAARNAACNAIVVLFDGATGDSTGDLAFATATPTVICICNFSATSFGSASTGVATAAAISTGTATGSGTVTQAFFRDKSNATIVTCAVSTSASDINLSSVTISTNDTISISSLTFTVPAS